MGVTITSSQVFRRLQDYKYSCKRKKQVFCKMIRMNSFPERIRHAVEIAGGQTKLARKVTDLMGKEVRPQAIQYLCNSAKPARSSSLTIFIAEATGLDPIWLSTGKGSPTPNVTAINPDTADNGADTPLAQNIRKKMGQTGKSVQDIADHLGVTYEMARRYTLATARPRQDKLAALAELLETTPLELDYGTPQQPKVTVTKVATPPEPPSTPPTRSLSFKNPEEMARYLAAESPEAIAEFLRHLVSNLADKLDKK